MAVGAGMALRPAPGHVRWTCPPSCRTELVATIGGQDGAARQTVAWPAGCSTQPVPLFLLVSSGGRSPPVASAGTPFLGSQVVRVHIPYNLRHSSDSVGVSR